MNLPRLYETDILYYLNKFGLTNNRKKFMNLIVEDLLKKEKYQTLSRIDIQWIVREGIWKYNNRLPKKYRKNQSNPYFNIKK